MMVTIERLRESLSYDPSTGLLSWKFRPRARARNDRVGKPVGGLRKDGYLGVCVDRCPLLVHRVAWAIHYGSWPIGHLDHINRVRHDNRIDNLREVSFSENCQNTSRYKNNKSGVKGVSRHTEGKWQATISLEGNIYYLGLFDTIDDAKEARAKAVHKLHTCMGEQ